VIIVSMALYMPVVSQLVIENGNGPITSPLTWYFPYETSF